MQDLAIASRIGLSWREAGRILGRGGSWPDETKGRGLVLRFVRGYPDRHQHTGSLELALDGAKLMTLSDEELLERVLRER